jgi:hypothetical protein
MRTLVTFASKETATGTNQTKTADGVTVTTFSDGTEVRLAPAGTAEAANKRCRVNSVCLWAKELQRCEVH